MSDISLRQLSIATPCTADWDAMTGDDRMRHCGDCKLNVYNVSAMTETEALDLIRTTEGRVCMRLHKRADGTVITSDCPVGLRAAARRRLALMVAKVAAVVAIAGSAMGLYRATRGTESCSIEMIEPFASIHNWLDPGPGLPLMGDIAIPPGFNQPAPPPSGTR